MRKIVIKEPAIKENSFDELPVGGFGIVTKHNIAKYVGHLVHKNYKGDVVMMNAEDGDYWRSNQNTSDTYWHSNQNTSDTSRLRILAKGTEITITI